MTAKPAGRRVMFAAASGPPASRASAGQNCVRNSLGSAGTTDKHEPCLPGSSSANGLNRPERRIRACSTTKRALTHELRSPRRDGSPNVASPVLKVAGVIPSIALHVASLRASVPRHCSDLRNVPRCLASDPEPDESASLYAQLCASCHGPSLDGGQAPSLHSAVWSSTGREWCTRNCSSRASVAFAT
jgi:hypothetical protein